MEPRVPHEPPRRLPSRHARAAAAGTRQAIRRHSQDDPRLKSNAQDQGASNNQVEIEPGPSNPKSRRSKSETRWRCIMSDVPVTVVLPAGGSRTAEVHNDVPV